MIEQRWYIYVMDKAGNRLKEHERAFTDQAEAVQYTNKLLRAGFRARMRPSAPKWYIDRLAEQGPPGWLKKK